MDARVKPGHDTEDVALPYKAPLTAAAAESPDRNFPATG